MHDVTFRVPLVVRRPGTVTAGRMVDRIVSHVDLLPTVLDHVGLGEVQVAGSPGRSLEPLLAGGDLADPSERAFFENETARSVRTPTHLYTEHLSGTGDPELYDLVDDPGQWHNVAGDPAHAEVVTSLSSALSTFFAEYADPRYDLWNGGRCQGIVSRYVTFKERYGPDWDMTMEVGPAFTDRR
jgi:arylsulfatase A-like enzyme